MDLEKGLLKGPVLDAEAPEQKGWHLLCGKPQRWDSRRQEDGQLASDGPGGGGSGGLTLGSGSLTHLHALFSLCPGEDSSDLIRHFLIESSAKGVHLKGAEEEPYFGEPAGRLLGGPRHPGPGGAWERPSHTGPPVSSQGASLPLCASIPSCPWPCPANSPSRRKVGLGPTEATSEHRGLLVLTREAPSGRHVSPSTWFLLVSQLTGPRASRPVNISAS